MNELQTAEEFCKTYTRLRSAMALKDLTDCMTDFAKLHVKAALEAASKNTRELHGMHGMLYESILNSYGDENIK